MAIDTTSIARGELGPSDEMKGEIKAKVRQVVLDTEGACLSMLIKDSEDKSRGYFDYVPVPKDATCASLMSKGWPVKTTEPNH
jgi:hypothetical protein